MTKPTVAVLLAPCPICNGKARLYQPGSATTRYRVSCAATDLMTANIVGRTHCCVAWGSTEEEVVLCWNGDALPAPAKARKAGKPRV